MKITLKLRKSYSATLEVGDETEITMEQLMTMAAKAFGPHVLPTPPLWDWHGKYVLHRPRRPVYVGHPDVVLPLEDGDKWEISELKTEA